MMGGVKTRPRPGMLLRRWWMVLLLPLAGALVLLARLNPDFVQTYYSGGLYLFLAGTLGRLTSLVPFSIMELVICGFIITAVVMLVILVVRVVKILTHRAAPESVEVTHTAGRLIKLVSVLLFSFVILCGLNYYRPEFTAFSGLTVRESSIEELSQMCMELVSQANILREGTVQDAQGVTQLKQNIFTTAKTAKETFGLLAAEYRVLPDLGITPKPVVNSWWMSMTQITGVFSPFTYEANINAAAPDYSIPATMCHELAHTRGFMREDEANFIAYLACQQSGSTEFRYSGVMLGLVHSINRLYAVDREAFDLVNAQMSPGVHMDFADNNAYWAQFEGPVAKVSEAVNNTYLRVNNQSDGVQSYGRMVDLLLAEYRQRHGITDGL